MLKFHAFRSRPVCEPQHLQLQFYAFLDEIDLDLSHFGFFSDGSWVCTAEIHAFLDGIDLDLSHFGFFSDYRSRFLASLSTIDLDFWMKILLFQMKILFF